MTNKNIYDLIIIGGGPAGIVAGIYGARQKLQTLLISREIGGQLLKKVGMIENYPGFEEISGMELIKRFEKHLRKFTRLESNSKDLMAQVEIEMEIVTRVENLNEIFSVFSANKKEFKARAVIVATGAQPRLLEIPGEKEFIGRGLSYCAICDGALFGNKNVAIVGGGNSAFEAAIYLSKVAKKVYILEASPEIRVDKENQDVVKKTGKVEIFTSVVPKKIQGEKFVKSLIYDDRKTGQEKMLAVEGVFVEIGSIPATDFVKGLVDFNEKDEIKIDAKTCMTKTSGLFAAGDVTEIKDKQIVIAAGQGAQAALSVYDYLQKF